jgi:hypothetical protein
MGPDASLSMRHQMKSILGIATVIAMLAMSGASAMDYEELDYASA